jgi:hypothetical protein
MALVLTLSQDQGFVAGKRRFLVNEVKPTEVDLWGPNDTSFKITQDTMTEVSEGVRVYLGSRATTVSSRVAIAAPQSIEIQRVEADSIQYPLLGQAAVSEYMQMSGVSDDVALDDLFTLCEASTVQGADIVSGSYCLVIEDGELMEITRR